MKTTRNILDLFCSVDAYWQQFEPLRERDPVATSRHHRRATQLHPSEIMTLLIRFQRSSNRIFKGFGTQHIQRQLRAESPCALSYTCFVVLITRVLPPLAVYLQTQLAAVPTSALSTRPL